MNVNLITESCVRLFPQLLLRVGVLARTSILGWIFIAIQVFTVVMAIRVIQQDFAANREFWSFVGRRVLHPRRQTTTTKYGDWNVAKKWHVNTDVVLAAKRFDALGKMAKKGTAEVSGAGDSNKTDVRALENAVKALEAENDHLRRSMVLHMGLDPEESKTGSWLTMLSNEIGEGSDESKEDAQGSHRLTMSWSDLLAEEPTSDAAGVPKRSSSFTRPEPFALGVGNRGRPSWEDQGIVGVPQKRASTATILKSQVFGELLQPGCNCVSFNHFSF